jgi:hypothetical protein
MLDMKYISVILLISLFISSCEKGTNNSSRSMMLGNYHFISVDFNTHVSKRGFDTVRYDGTVTIGTPDNGNGINVPYPAANQQLYCKTVDSSFCSVAFICPGNLPPISGGFQHDTLYMMDYSYGCESNDANLYVSTIAVKY